MGGSVCESVRGQLVKMHTADPELKLSSNGSSAFVLFDLILCIPSTIFQLNRDGSSWAEPVLS